MYMAHAGFAYAVLDVDAQNQGALRNYLAAGFRQEETIAIYLMSLMGKSAYSRSQEGK